MHENRQITAAKCYVLPAVLSTIMMKKFSSPFFHDDNEAMKSPLSTKVWCFVFFWVFFSLCPATVRTLCLSKAQNMNDTCCCLFA